MGQKTYSERFCPHCEQNTKHYLELSMHERDSSGDYYECQTCRWWTTGIWPNDYNPPLGA